MVQIEEFIEEFVKGVDALLESRINREDIRVLVSPFVFNKLHASFTQYSYEKLNSGFWNMLTAKAKPTELTILGVTFGPTDGWPNFNIMLSFRDADIIASSVKPITLESKKWL